MLVAVRFSDGSDSKPRPAIVISDDNYNSKFRDFICIPMTSVLTEREHAVIITNKDFESGYLLKPSLAKVDKVTSIAQNTVIRKIGVLDKTAYEKVMQELFSLLK